MKVCNFLIRNMLRKIKCARSLFIFILIVVIELQNSYADGSIIGPQGLILTPTATFPTNRQVHFGVSQIGAPYVFIDGDDVSENFLFYSSLVYLPRLEITLLLTTAPGLPGNDGSNTYKDAAVLMQYFAVTEKEYVPAIAIGAYDFYSYSYYTALFIVFSKNLESVSRLPLRVHLGYGVDWMDKHYGDTGPDRNAAVPHHLVGIFGGFELELWKHFNLTVEYDSRKFNSGMRIDVFNQVQFFGTLFNFNTFSGGLSYRFII